MGSHTELRMKIEKDRVVRFHYTVSEVGQAPLESSKDRDPIAILVGHGNIIPGLEAAMQDKEAGENFQVDVPALEAYGERREGMDQRVPKKHFGNTRLQPGTRAIERHGRSSRGAGSQPGRNNEKNAGQTASSSPRGTGGGGCRDSHSTTSAGLACARADDGGKARNHSAQP